MTEFPAAIDIGFVIPSFESRLTTDIVPAESRAAEDLKDIPPDFVTPSFVANVNDPETPSIESLVVI